MKSQGTSKAGEMDWKDIEFRFKNSFMPIKANYVGAPEDITEPILDFIRQALTRQREEIVKLLRMLEVQRLSGGGDKYDYSTNMAKWYNAGIEAAIDEFNKRLDELK